MNVTPHGATSQPRPIVILGSTGSIGRQALAVAKALPQRLRVVGLAAGCNAELLAEQIAEWQPEIAALADEAGARSLKSQAIGRTKIVGGMGGVEEVASWPSASLLLGAMLGAAGLKPTLTAIEAGKDIAIANKETLVAAGEIVVAAARRRGVALLPVDSEHSAIAQCLRGEDAASIARLAITASGGPFVDTPRAELQSVTAAQALKHPTWTMGRKITVDSATLMNKGLEAIEARWLFDVPMERIDVVVHRQSIVHSLVSFCDGSVKAQLGVPDMQLPIQWALLHPDRVAGPAPALDIAAMGPLSFEPPDEERFPALGLAWRAAAMGGVAPCMMNAANEVAVEAFLCGETGFYGITGCIEAVLECCSREHGSPGRRARERAARERYPAAARPAHGLNEILEADIAARHLAREWLQTNGANVA